METKTYEDWSKYLGTRPHRLGVVARYYTDNTLSFITDGLRNIFYNDEKVGRFQTSNSLVFEWDIDVNHIKKIEFADAPLERGENGSEITFAFKERYFEKYDIFQIDETRQQCIVIARPVRKRDKHQ